VRSAAWLDSVERANPRKSQSVFISMVPHFARIESVRQ
jgi:hypothetical protein